MTSSVRYGDIARPQDPYGGVRLVALERGVPLPAFCAILRRLISPCQCVARRNALDCAATPDGHCNEGFCPQRSRLPKESWRCGLIRRFSKRAAGELRPARIPELVRAQSAPRDPAACDGHA